MIFANMTNSLNFICPQHKLILKINSDNSIYQCPLGCEYAIKDHIPRFVPADNYANSFGLQWNAFRKTQLDSYTKVPISTDRLKRIAGGSLDIFKGKNILEAGCGAGRFTEVMLDAGAQVWAVDLSTAVDANYQNCHNKPGYFVCQADIMSLPFDVGQFDMVVCIGVIQHTPDPELTIQTLCSNLKPGGMLLMDIYSQDYPVTSSRRVLRKYLSKKSEMYSMRFVRMVTALLWPLHQILFKMRNMRGFGRVRNYFISLSPIVDYQEAYPALGSKLLYQWAVLDTHDTLTDHFKHFRNAEEIQKILTDCGMTAIETAYAGNGVEARARKN